MPEEAARGWLRDVAGQTTTRISKSKKGNGFKVVDLTAHQLAARGRQGDQATDS
jgi:hypothetical protein